MQRFLSVFLNKRIFIALLGKNKNSNMEVLLFVVLRAFKTLSTVLT